VLVILTLTLPSVVRGQAQPAKPGEKEEERWVVDRAMTISPKAAPTPNLKYRLMPLSSDRKEGNAVPIYLRFAHERSDATKTELSTKVSAWNQLPLAELPVAEARAYLTRWKYNLKQMELAARRKTADWNYTFDTGNGVIDLLLPDVQEMRMQAGLLALKIRVEIAEGNYDEAIHTLETAYSFSQQINEGPFLISSLVGVAVASIFSNALIDLEEQPNAPNLYWALATLPRPLIDLRKAMEFEYKVLDMQYPDLAEIDKPRTPAEWDAILKKIRTDIQRLALVEGVKPGPSSRMPNDPADKSPDLDEARHYLTEKAGLKPEAVKAMVPAQLLLTYAVYAYREYRDLFFETAYLSYPEARPFLAEAEKKLKGAPDSEGLVFARALLPALIKVRGAEARLDRRIGMHRTIEALRLHAATGTRQLPASLDEVKIVPIPIDVGTGKPFEYKLDGDTAILSSRIPGESTAISGMRFKITMRK
jgi:tetratricopeptide (TPR) repeat protein